MIDPIALGPANMSTTIPCRKVTVRGARGAFFGSEIGVDLSLQLYVGDRTISIFADSTDRALRAAEALRPVDAVRATTDDLPAPTIDVGPGLARCS